MGEHMLETTIPEINVTELMERVRREAARIESNREHAVATGATLPLPKIAVPPPVPGAPLPLKKRKVQPSKLETLLQRGRDKNDRPGVPKLFRRLFRRQGSYNRVILETTEILTRSVAELGRQLNELAHAIQMQNQWSADTSRYEHEIRTWMMRAAEEFG